MLSEHSRELDKIPDWKNEFPPAIAKNSRQVIVKQERVRLPSNETHGFNIVQVFYDGEACYPSLSLADTPCIPVDVNPDVVRSKQCVRAMVLELIMRTNYIKVNNQYFIQLYELAMCMGVTTPFANVYLLREIYATLQTHGKQAIFKKNVCG